MHRNKNILLIGTLCASFFISSCLFGDKKGESISEKDHPNWPDVMKNSLSKSDYTEAFGLFSSSGWSNEGQVMVFDGHPKLLIRVDWVEANSRRITDSYTLNQKQTNSIRSTFADAKGLKDVNPPVFDGVQFEFHHLVKKNQMISTVHKIFMNNPDQAEPKPAKHLALINAMQSLKKNSNLKENSPIKGN